MKKLVSEWFLSFQYITYLWLWLTVTFTNTGKWVFTLGVTWHVYHITESSFWSGAIMFALMFPNLVGAPIVGVLADKFERRKLIYVAIGFTLLVLTTLTITTMTGLLSPIGMVALSFMFGLGSSMINVVMNTIVPGIVPKKTLYNAYSLKAVGQRGSEFVGPLLATPLLAFMGPQLVYIIGAVIYVLAILFVGFLNVPKMVENDLVDQENFISSLITGLNYIRNNRYIFGIIVLVGLHCALTMAFMGMLPSFVTKGLGSKSDFYGFLMSMVGLGAIFGTLSLAGLKSHALKVKLFWASSVLSGLSLSFLGLSSNKTFAIIAILLVGSSQALFMTLTNAFIQEATDEHVRGRVTSVYYVLAAGLMSIANWGYGWLGNVIDPRLIMVTTGIVFLVVVVLYWGATNKAMARPTTVNENISV
ncbi:MFS transporter [Pontibacillus marinus]|uniref:Major facilitator superfamily (MFS) profile domain-containing protein n=1 Tax=Pontibacillus marinus BH030004 = DSM 16465 TaxID=1385511 RepID=A0A0A5FT35_9BACI|nr:MFS transporter [Pontibacillus marinus]KGX83931.1 hypothetical protein N783_20560 [Pontibacillus marinus BH030004 = DSM 16465]